MRKISNNTTLRPEPLDAAGQAPIFKEIPFPFEELEKIKLGMNPQQRLMDHHKAIVIGLGKTGEIVLRQWLHQLSVDLSLPAAKSPPLRACVMDRAEEPAAVPFRYLRLTGANQDNWGGMIVQKNLVRSLFLQEHNLNNFRAWLQGCLYDLKIGIRVVLVGSLGDPMIGALGEVLHVLKKISSGNSYQSVVALLAVDAPPNIAMDTGESYAVLREITRMSAGGIHLVEAPPTLPGNFIASSMLDQIFLIGSGVGPQGSPDVKEADFDFGTTQVLSQVLSTLLHPASTLIWDHLHNLPHLGGKAVVHTISISSLVMPVREMEAYLSACLAIAAVYGERTDKPGEGVLSRGPNADRPPLEEAASSLVRDWFAMGPSPHPFFNLLFSNEINANRQMVHSVSSPDEFLPAFQTQLGDGLTRFLNQDGRGDLQTAKEALNWLLQRLVLWQSNLAPTTGNAPRFQSFFARCLEIVRDIESQLTAWSLVMESLAAHNLNQAVVPAGWGSLDDGQSVGNDTLWQLLKEKKTIAVEALQQAGSGRSRRAVTNLLEVDDYYKGTIRPELSQYGMGNSLVFQRVRERLAWYVRIAPGESPRLLFICLPAGASGKDIPDNAYYWHTDVRKLADAIDELAFELVRARTAELAPNWFEDLLGRNDRFEFMRRANHPILSFHNGSEKLTYLIAENNVILDANLRRIFSDTFYNVNQLTGGDAGAITALTIWTNISLASIDQVRQWQQTYKHNSHALHPYPQEKNALIYERRAHSKLGIDVNIHPGLSLSLVDLRRVTLFCQALFSGLIDLKQAEDDGQEMRWTIEPLGNFPHLEMAPGQRNDPLGLKKAFDNFTISLPAGNQTLTDLNPQAHFGGGRENYMRLIHQIGYEDRIQTNFPQCAPDLIEKIKKDWSSSTDENIRAFAAILAVELQEPVWEDWNSLK